AAHLAAGGALEALGSAAGDLVRLHMAEPLRAGGRVRGEVVQVDRYGTLLSNIPGAALPENGHVRLGGRDVGRLHGTFGDVGSGELVALVGSEGLLEVALRDGSAAEYLGVGRGARVEVVEGGREG
ncbi:MAG TPA: SAM hydroxide adenosyltransferase, partial [Longimicrobiales bacterium]|nr:SAM hydroxide adenosyltransferase [Longimicrobiales bacterium]